MESNDTTKKLILFSFLFLFLGLLLFGAVALGIDIKPKEKENEIVNEEVKYDETKDTIRNSTSGLRDDDNNALTNKKSVIIYYSLSGTTEKVAKYIHDKTGFEIVKLETHKTYPKDDAELMQEEIDNEKANFIYPKLKNDLHLTEYDIIYLGFPIWYNEMARPIYTFFQDNDLSGTTIVPFVCSDNYGTGQVVSMIQKAAPYSLVYRNPLAITNYNRDNYKEAVDSWVKEVEKGLAEGEKFD